MGEIMLNLWRGRSRWGSIRQRSRQQITTEEAGQGLVEASVAFLFLLTILLVMFEMVIVFTSYITLLNAVNQGAVYAAGHPTMQIGDDEYDVYTSTIRSEVLAGGLSWRDIRIYPPELPDEIQAGEPLTVTIDYTLTTFASEIIMPLFGRFGLPTEYHIRAKTSVPIR